jgi:hypothetical protein
MYTRTCPVCGNQISDHATCPFCWENRFRESAAPKSKSGGPKAGAVNPAGVGAGQQPARPVAQPMRPVAPQQPARPVAGQQPARLVAQPTRPVAQQPPVQPVAPPRRVRVQPPVDDDMVVAEEVSPPPPQPERIVAQVVGQPSAEQDGDGGQVAEVVDMPQDEAWPPPETLRPGHGRPGLRGATGGHRPHAPGGPRGGGRSAGRPVYAVGGVGVNAPGAVGSLVCGILSLICLGIILGPVAVFLGNSAMTRIRQNPGTYTGQGMAQAGMICGIIGAVLCVIWIILMTLKFAIIMTMFQ